MQEIVFLVAFATDFATNQRRGLVRARILTQFVFDKVCAGRLGIAFGLFVSQS